MLTSTSCKRPVWDSDLLFPLAYGNLTIKNIVKDTNLLSSDNAGNVSLYFSDTLFSLNIDTLLQPIDTNLTDSFQWSFGTILIPPDQFIYNQNKSSIFNFKSAQLRTLKIKQGKVYFEVFNRFFGEILVQYSLPKATKNGNSIQLTKLVSPATISGPGYLKDSIDLSDYLFDLTGENGNQTNVIFSTYSIKSSPDGGTITANTGDYAKIVTTLSNIVPQYANGYFGTSIEKIESSTDIHVFKELQGMLDLDEVLLDINIQNGLGIDCRINFQEISTSNSTNSSHKTLVAPFINQNINISRALEITPIIGPVQYTSHVLSLNKSNSNLDELIEMLPNYLHYDFTFEINPYQNIGAKTDFIFTNHIPYILMNTKVPLKFNLKQFLLKDTIALKTSKELSNALAKTKSGTLHVLYKNSFPLNATIHIVSTNKNFHIMDTLARNVTVVSSNNEEFIDIPLTGAQIQNLRSAHHVIVSVSLNSSQYPYKVYIKENQDLDLSISLDVNYEL